MVHKRALTMLPGLLLSQVAFADVKVDYEMSGQNAIGDRAPTGGRSGFVVEIDGPAFRITSQRGAVEVSSDDGATTFFGQDRTTPQHPLVPTRDATAPIQAAVDDEHVVVGESHAGPDRFGLPTRIYPVDHDYAIDSRVGYVFTNSTRYHAHYTMTVVDAKASSAAVRVALSRGYPHALSQRADAFTGLPVEIDGTIESGSGASRNLTTFHLQARSLEQHGG